MGFFNKLLGKSEANGTSVMEQPDCPHTALTPRWESVADMGNDEKATGYTCQGCNQSFTPEQGHALRRSEGERVQRELAID